MKKKGKNWHKDEVFGAEALAPIKRVKVKSGPKLRAKEELRGVLAIKRTEYYKERMRYILGETEE